MSAFAPDGPGLHRAVDMLLSAKSRSVGGIGEAGALPDTWQEAGLGEAAALEALAAPALEQVTRLDDPGFFAHMDPPTPWPTWATSMWAAAMNQNLLHPDTAPSARILEQRVVEWLSPAFGMGGGHMVPGSTVANLTALWAAREVAGVRRVVCSAANHLSVAKSAHLLGLELVEIPVNQASQLRLDLLPDDLRQSAVVLAAGTVATGAVDPLTAIDAAWVHVDAAWAGPLRLSSHASVLTGIEGADSVSVSAHKWLYQPKESALVLFADPDRAHRTMTFGGGYLAAPNVGLLGSHGVSAALALAATLLAWGRQGVRAHLDAAMALADDLATEVERAGLELWRWPVTGVVNWRVPGVDSNDLQRRLQGAWVSCTQIDGETWLRSVAANPNADAGTVVAAVLRAV